MMTSRVQRIAFRLGAALFAAISADALALSARQTRTFRSEVQAVALYATVRDHDGHLVPNLAQEDFQIIDNGRTAHISTFSNESLPITLALMLDLSGAMLQDLPSGGHDMGPDVITTEQEFRANVVTDNVASRYARVRAAAEHLVDVLQPDDRVRIGTISNQEVAVSPLLTGDKGVLHRILREELWPLGTPNLWRGLKVAMDSIAKEAGRKVVLAFSSGIDRCPVFVPGRCVEPRTVNQEAVAGEFMVYAIGFPVRGVHDRLIRLSEDTGGGHFVLMDDAALASTFEGVVDELHHQYAIGFVPVVRDGKTHTLAIKIAGRGLTVRARNSYVAAVQ
jgi:VWFA-related protein